MPLLFPPGTWVRDADGNPLSGAQVRVYDANTTSEADLFSNSGLSVALSNPVITNADGYPSSDGANECLIWIAGGEYDVAFLDEDDVVLVSWDDVQPVGGEGGDSETTVSGNGRVAWTGAAGEVFLRIGDPSPDDIGGTLRIQGWDGTQADEIELKADEVKVAGDLTVKGGKKLPGYVATPATTFTAVSEVIVALTESPADVRSFVVDVFDLSNSAAGILPALQFCYDGSGTVFKSGASDYAFSAQVTDQVGGGFVNSVHDDAHTHIQLMGSPGLAPLANKPHWLRLEIITPESGAGATIVRSTLTGYDDGATDFPTVIAAAGYGLGGYGRATHVRLFIASGGGTLTGKYRTEVRLGFGD